MPSLTPDENKTDHGAEKTAEIELLLGKLYMEQKSLSALLDILPVGVVIATDPTCQVIRHNSFASDFYRAEEAWDNISHSAPEQPPYKLLHKGRELAPAEMPIQLAAWYGQSVSDYEIDYVWDDGIRKTALYSSHPIRDDKGNIVGAIATFQEITSRKQYEEELRKRDQQLEDANRKLEDANKELQQEILHCLQVEQALQTSNKKTVHILESISDGFFAFDREWRFTYANAEALRQMGIQDASEMIGQVAWDAFPNYADIAYEMLHKAVSEQTTVRYEMYSQITGRWHDLHAYPSPDGLSVYCLDTTELKETQSKLQKSQQDISDILNSISDPFITLDNQWRITYVNQGSASYFGKTQAELSGQNYLDVVPNLVNSDIYKNCCQTMFERVPTHFEEKGVCRDLWLDFNAYPCQDGIAIYFRDITEKKRLQQELLVSEERFRAAIENMLDSFGIYTAIRNDDGQIEDFLIEYVNEAACRSNAMTKEEQVGKCLLNTFLGYRNTELFDEYCQVVETGEPLAKETLVWENAYRKHLNGAYDLRAVKLGDGVAISWRNVTERKRMEEELRSSEQQLRLIMDTIPSRMTYVDSEKRYKYVNKAHGEWWHGVNGKNAQAKHIWEVIGEEAYHKIQAHIDTVLSGERVSYEIELPGKDGEKHYFYSIMVPEIDDRGTVRGYITLTNDMTEFRAMEQKIAEALEFNQAILESSPLGICTFDSSGQCVFANDAAARMTGGSKEQILQQNFNNFEHWKQSGLLDAAKRVLSTGTHEHLEVYIRNIFGKQAWSDSKLSRFTSGGESHLLLVYEDITERKEAGEALRQSEERFSRAFHSNPCPMVIISLTDYRYIDANQQWLDAVGISREEAIGRTIDEVGVLSESQFQNKLQTLEEHGEAKNHEVVYINRKGEERYGLRSGEIITINGERCLLAAAIDITERKKYEKEMTRLDRLNLMGEIAGGIAHEIRNPMTVVRGYLQMMQFKEEFASHKKRFDTMIGEIDRANAIITEFLSLARNAPPDLKIQSINSILTAIFPLIQADAAGRGIVISLSVLDTPEINLDEKQIRQLVLNLVRNGIEAMPRHGELTIKTSMKKNRVVLSIKDRGNGIPPDVLEKLGTPFFTTKEKGTGLGLPVCYRIAESHNARIEIKTGKRGTTFMVSFQVPSLQDEVSDI